MPLFPSRGEKKPDPSGLPHRQSRARREEERARNALLMQWEIRKAEIAMLQSVVKGLEATFSEADDFYAPYRREDKKRIEWAHVQSEDLETIYTDLDGFAARLEHAQRDLTEFEHDYGRRLGIVTESEQSGAIDGAEPPPEKRLELSEAPAEAASRWRPRPEQAPSDLSGQPQQSAARVLIDPEYGKRD